MTLCALWAALQFSSGTDAGRLFGRRNDGSDSGGGSMASAVAKAAFRNSVCTSEIFTLSRSSTSSLEDKI